MARGRVVAGIGHQQGCRGWLQLESRDTKAIGKCGGVPGGVKVIMTRMGMGIPMTEENENFRDGGKRF